MVLTDTTRAEAEREPTLPAAEWPVPPRRRVFRRALMVQFVQFCLVGALSTALNAVLLYLLMGHGLGKNWSHFLAFGLAVTNGFFLNRAWTFRHSRRGAMERQYMMFVAVNVVGSAIAWLIMTHVGGWLRHAPLTLSTAQLFLRLTGHLPDPVRWAYTLGELAATPFCAVWNFSANKLWTFRSSPSHK